MIKMKSSNCLKCFLGLTTLCSLLNLGSAQAEIPVIFNPPENRRDSQEDDLGPGGSPRPNCSELGIPEEACSTLPLPLIPHSEVGYWGYTSVDAPVFWIYIPYDASRLEEGAIFELLDENYESVIPQIKVDLSNTPGVISIQMPDETVLSPGETYIWYFEILVRPGERSLNQPIFGLIEKVLILDEDLEDLSSLERAAYFADRGIWFDALTELMILQNEYPNVLQDFLRSNDLDGVLPIQSQLPTNTLAAQ